LSWNIGSNNRLNQPDGESHDRRVEWASTRSASKKIPVWEEMGIKESWNTRSVALSALIAALYAAYVFYFSVTSFQVVQVRVVDALLPLSILFGPPAIVGVTLGALVGNLLGSPFGPVDVVGGTIANLVAATLAWVIGRRKFAGAWLVAIGLEIASVTLIVGSYLIALTSSPGVPLWVGWVEFLFSEVIAIGILGYPLLKAVGKATKRNPLLRPENPS
jgi:uncharacterized membrane protein